VREEYLLGCFAGEGDHFEGHLVDGFNELEDGLEINVAEADVVAEKARGGG
jgi:hypothetical protein